MTAQFFKSNKRLIINADDYGASSTINTAVEELAQAGLLGGVSVLANGDYWEPAVTFLQTHSQVSAGVHLNLIEGKPVAPPSEVTAILGLDGNFLKRSPLMLRWVLHPIAVSRAVEIEWRAQIERLLSAGVRLTHADSHQHLHAFPPAFRIAVNLCRAYGIPALRIPCEVNPITARTLPAQALQASLFLARRLSSTSSLRLNDHFLGFKRAGGYGINEFLEDLPQLQPGVTELALHPSTKNFSPYPALRGNDEREALLSQSFQSEIQRLQITLTRWEDL